MPPDPLQAVSAPAKNLALHFCFKAQLGSEHPEQQASCCQIEFRWHRLWDENKDSMDFNEA